MASLNNCFLVFVIIFSVGITLSEQQYSYRAAVVEYAVKISTENITDHILENTKKYISYIEDAALQGVDIIVFPESTLNNGFTPDRNRIIEHAFFIPDPKDEVFPCDTRNSGFHQALISLSCQARSSKMYLVINVSEKKACPENLDTRPCSGDGYNLYNTNVVFDREGRIVSRYRKYNLFGEAMFNTTMAPEEETFSTDFNVTFAHLICFDLMFSQPSLTMLYEKGVKNIIAPMMWYSELPFLTAIQFQQSWAYSHNINVLAAGANSPRSGSGGSGIYSGRLGAVAAFVTGNLDSSLLVATLDGELLSNVSQSVNIESVEAQEMSMLRDHLDRYSWKPVDLSLREGITTSICHFDFCCSVFTKASVHSDAPYEGHYTYMAVAFDGVRTYSGVASGGVQTCGLIACIGSDIGSCGKMFTNTSLGGNVEFEEISIFGSFRKTNSTQFPVSLKRNLLPLSSNHVHYHISKSETNPEDSDITMKLVGKSDNLLTFAIFGRDFSKDGLPVSDIMKVSRRVFATQNLVLREIGKEHSESTTEYILFRLQILIFIVSVYCLEQM